MSVDRFAARTRTQLGGVYAGAGGGFGADTSKFQRALDGLERTALGRGTASVINNLTTIGTGLGSISAGLGALGIGTAIFAGLQVGTSRFAAELKSAKDKAHELGMNYESLMKMTGKTPFSARAQAGIEFSAEFMSGAKQTSGEWLGWINSFFDEIWGKGLAVRKALDEQAAAAGRFAIRLKESENAAGNVASIMESLKGKIAGEGGKTELELLFDRLDKFKGKLPSYQINAEKNEASRLFAAQQKKDEFAEFWVGMDDLNKAQIDMVYDALDFGENLHREVIEKGVDLAKTAADKFNESSAALRAALSAKRITPQAFDAASLHLNRERLFGISKPEATSALTSGKDTLAALADSLAGIRQNDILDNGRRQLRVQEQIRDGLNFKVGAL